MMSRPSGRARRWALGTMWLVLVVDLLGLALHGAGLSPLIDGWLGGATPWGAVVVCLLASRRAGWRRGDVLLATAAVSLFAVGNTYYVLVLAGGGSVSFPSLADIGYVAFYPCVVVAVLLAVRRQGDRPSGYVALDSLVGGLGAATVMAVFLERALVGPLSGPISLTAVVSVAYPAGDLLLVAAAAATSTVRGLRSGHGWVLLVLGLGLFAASDVDYLLRVLSNTYEVGTLLDGGWVLGLALIATWVDRSVDGDRPFAGEQVAPAVTSSLVVPVAATATALGVLLLGTRTHLGPVAVALAGSTLAAAGLRYQLAFRALRRMGELRILARTDDLTGLPNRRALYADALLCLTAEPSHRRALLLLDLDKFKDVNDGLGHHSGDRVLIEVSRRLEAWLRPGDVLARLGGDEFAVLADLGDGADAGLVAAELRASVEPPITVDGLVLHVVGSVGISLFPEQGPDLATLLRKADIAMYQAKTKRLGQAVYADTDTAGAEQRLRMLEELHNAFEREEFVLHYQPKLDLRSDDVRSVEALVRWEHPHRGLLYPIDFLGLVEDSGLMQRMTALVARTALDQVVIWAQRGVQLSVAVNVSPSSLADDSLAASLLELLRERHLPASVLQVEVTEEFLMVDPARASTALTQLRDRGVQVSVDDFGTGYSSLAYLRDLPVDELKLDRAFIWPMDESPRAVVLVASTIDLAHRLGLRIVAEGVESASVSAQLATMGCDLIQGYFLSKPLDPVALIAWLDGWAGRQSGAAEQTDLAADRT